MRNLFIGPIQGKIISNAPIDHPTLTHSHKPRAPREGVGSPRRATHLILSNRGGSMLLLGVQDEKIPWYGIISLPVLQLVGEYANEGYVEYNGGVFEHFTFS